MKIYKKKLIRLTFIDIGQYWNGMASSYTTVTV